MKILTIKTEGEFKTMTFEYDKPKERGKKIELPRKEKPKNINLADRIYTWEEKNEFCEKMGKQYNKEYGEGTLFNDILFTILNCGASFEYIENNIHKFLKD